MSTIRFNMLRRPLTVIACAALIIVCQSAIAQESLDVEASSFSADAELTALREDVRVLRQGVERLARALEPRRAEAPPARAVQHPNDDTYYARTYAVADLALPLPKSVKVTFDEKLNPVVATAEAGRDLIALEESIMSHVDPASWVAAGGAATITRFPGNMSLLINQSEPNHQQITELVEALRGRRRIVLETRVISGARSSFLNQIANLGIPVPTARRPQPLSAHQTKVLLAAAQDDRRTNLISVPVLTLLPGQLAQFCLPAEAADETNVLIRADVEAHSQVRLTVVANAQDAIDALRSAASITLRPDEPVLIDIPQRVAYAASGDAIPLADRLASSATGGNGGNRALLLVTPRIVNRDPRELLGAPSTP